MKRGNLPVLSVRAIALVPIAAMALLLSGCPASSPNPTNAFLSFKYSRNCGDYTSCVDLRDTTEAKAYYCTIGKTGGSASGGVDSVNCTANPPTTPTLTLDDWKQANGFPASGNPDAHAIYGNLGDLRIGRDMNCVQSGQNVACYVTNYGPPPFVPVDPRCAFSDFTNSLWVGQDNTGCNYSFPNLGIAISDASTGNNPFATVAMVYNPNAGTENTVTFYTFNGAGNLLTIPALDGEGPKTTPRMCMACHGGSYDTNTHSVTATSFLPFDVYYFQYANDAGLTLDDQQEAFRKLNALVKATNPAQPIKDFIDGIYPNGVGNPGSQAADGYVPPGWSGHENLYNSVVRQYCRMCHVAQPQTFVTTFQGFQSSAALIEIRVCNTNDMPHAQVPFKLFWLKDHLAKNDLRDFLKAEGITDLHDCK